MDDLTDQKAQMRKAAFAARKSAHAAGQGEATTRLLAEIGPAERLVIAGYMPIRTEIDPLPAMAALVAQGATLGVPVIQAAGQPLRFRAWHPEVTLVEGPFGAAVPADGPWITPQVVIVPLVAFDVHMGRLGYGGGFYDRTLEGLRTTAATRAIGFAYDAQEAEHLPLETTDQPLDAIVTPTRTLQRG